MPKRPFSIDPNAAGHPDPSCLAPCDLPPFQGAIRPHWQLMALAKGYEIIGRVQDRYHLHLRCSHCAGTHVSKLFVLMSARPLCPHCLAARRQATAVAAGVTFLRQDPEASLYGFYRTSCGHVLRRQFELIDRAARGETALRCGICLIQREEAEAQRYGWQRLGPDETRPSNYRLYRHACGHVQSIAQANMAWGQCDCAACGESWTAKPSYVYLFDIRLPADGDAPSRRYLKLGYSAHPVKRYRHQLGLPAEAEVDVLRVVPMRTGHAGLRDAGKSGFFEIAHQGVAGRADGRIARLPRGDVYVVLMKREQARRVAVLRAVRGTAAAHQLRATGEHLGGLGSRGSHPLEVLIGLQHDLDEQIIQRLRCVPVIVGGPGMGMELDQHQPASPVAAASKPKAARQLSSSARIAAVSIALSAPPR